MKTKCWRNIYKELINFSIFQGDNHVDDYKLDDQFMLGVRSVMAYIATMAEESNSFNALWENNSNSYKLKS